jgi:tetratricopeptide (TPR) repeat protein
MTHDPNSSDAPSGRRTHEPANPDPFVSAVRARAAEYGELLDSGDVHALAELDELEFLDVLTSRLESLNNRDVASRADHTDLPAPVGEPPIVGVKGSEPPTERALIRAGVDACTRGRIEEAVRLFRDGRQRSAHHAARSFGAVCTMNLGAVLAYEGKHSEAQLLHSEAEHKFSGLGREIQAAESAMNLGVSMVELGVDLPTADHFQKLQAFFAASLLDVRAAECDQNLGVALARSGNVDGAIARYAKAREVFDAMGLEIRVAECDQNLGVALARSGNVDGAIARYAKAREVFDAMGLEIRVAECDQNLGVALARSGKLGRAIASYAKAREVFDAARLDLKVAESEHNLGVLLSLSGESRKAERHADAARSVFASRGCRLRAIGSLDLAVEHLATPSHHRVRSLRTTETRLIASEDFAPSLALSLDEPLGVGR